MRTRVRRERPRAVFIMAALAAFGVCLFALFARPAVIRAGEAAKQSEERVVSEVTLSGESVYLAELCVLADEASARVEAARYAPRGAAGYILAYDGLYSVIGSGYEEKDEAEKVAANLLKQEGISASVRFISADGARLKINSTPGQLKAFTEADDALRLASRELRECAAALDRGEKSPVEARVDIESLETRLKAAHKTLAEEAGDKPNSVAEAWLEVLLNASERLGEISREEYKTRLYLSSAVKHAFLDVRICHIKALKDLL